MDEDWTYKKWVSALMDAVLGNGPDAAERELYQLVDDIYSQGHQEGYFSGFGEGKVCCSGSCCECGPSDG